MDIPIEKIKKIIDRYGTQHQLYKAAEELSELQTILLQDANQNGKVPLARIIEEIADVYVMLKQVEVIYYIDSREVEPVIEYKINRTLSADRRSKEWMEEAKKEVQKRCEV